MRNGHARVTHNVTRESQPPVPSRPYPARPALYIERGETSTSIVTYVPRETHAGWMGVKP